jgi:uncharacterized protein YjeT (DUF2065 family)
MAGLWTIVGLFSLVAAAKAKKLYNRLLKGKNLKAISFIPLIGGVLLTFSARSSRLYWFVIIIALLALAKGFFFIFAPEKQAKSFVDWWLNASLSIYRLGGLVALTLGIFFFCRVA